VFEFLFTHPLWAYRTGTFAFASSWPLWLLVVSIVAGAFVIAWSVSRRRLLTWPRLLIVGALQTLMLALVLTLLWRPVLNVERVRDRENVLAVALDGSASMAYGEADQSRLQQAVAALRGGPLDALRKVFEVRLFSFAAETTPLNDLEAIPPPGPQTRIGDSLVRVLQSAGSVPLAGVVLVSDGAENGETLSEARLAEIASYGVPIHTVGVGPESNTNDLELERVDVASSAPPGATVTAEVGIRHHGATQTRLRVYDRDKIIASRDIKLRTDSEVENVALDLPAGDPGTRELRFGLDPLEGERNVINNERHRVMTVPATRRGVLYVEGEPRWEFKYLRRAVDGERSLRLASAVRTTPNKYLRQGVNNATDLEEGFPKDAAELFGYDAVIIGSYEAATLNSTQHRLLREFVDKRGGTVLFLGGRYGLSEGGWQSAPIAQALPVHLPGKDTKTFVRRTLSAELTRYALISPITQFDADAKRNAEQWKTLPPLDDYQAVGRLKPGAVVLLDAPIERGRAPLLVRQQYGRGATFVLATASTWRWQMQLPPEDKRHEMFWRQLLHAIADTAPPRAALTSERSSYDDERSVTLEAELHDEKFEPINDAKVELLVAPEREPSFVAQMEPSGRGDGRYHATIDAASAGLYRIDMMARGAGGGDAGTAVTHVLRTDGVLEHFATQQHRAVLERLATMTGGRYWTLNELDGLAAAIPYSKAGVIERQTLDLWNLPIVFLVLLALKGAEWLLRLKWGRL
jgi:uncharacterized membrane protein